jgi:hypothetical protein
MGISQDKKPRRTDEAQKMEEGMPCHGNDRGRGDGSDRTGTFFGDRTGGVERGPTSDADFDKVTLIVSITEFREIREAWEAGGTTLSIALALTKWHASCTFRAAERFMATGLGLRGTDVQDNEMIAVGYAPIHGVAGRLPGGEVNETVRVWAIVQSAHPRLLYMVKQLFAMVKDSHRL